MDYSYYASTMPSAFHYVGYGSGLDQFQQNEDMLPSSVESQIFDNSSFDFTYRPSFSRTGLTQTLPTSTSPQSPRHSRLPDGSLASAYSMSMEEHSGRRSSSVEKDNLAPTQSRRKAQNRAAQRAFRERKEKHVRDLEAKVEQLTSTTSWLRSDNERLKLLLKRTQSENDELRAKSSSLPSIREPSIRVDNPGIVEIRRQAQISSIQSRPSPLQKSSGDTFIDLDNGKPLSATGVWDVLELHPLYLSGILDVAKVCELLKDTSRCDGMDPLID